MWGKLRFHIVDMTPFVTAVALLFFPLPSVGSAGRMPIAEVVRLVTFCVEFAPEKLAAEPSWRVTYDGPSDVEIDGANYVVSLESREVLGWSATFEHSLDGEFKSCRMKAFGSSFELTAAFDQILGNLTSARDAFVGDGHFEHAKCEAGLAHYYTFKPPQNNDPTNLLELKVVRLDLKDDCP